MFYRVHFVYSNKHLQTRDERDFEDMWEFIEVKPKILYHVGYDFDTEQGDLVIIDEADTFMFENPCKF